MYQSVRNKKSIREKFVAFLEARNVSRTMLDVTSVIPPLGQIEVAGGVIFSQREIIKRNEFLDGEYIVIGAQTDYSPITRNADTFGYIVGRSGTMADTFSFRFSTKYFDADCDLYYYGYRYYSPELKRWITRDLIGEDGGVNLYAMCGNNLLSDYDSDGCKPASQAGTERDWVLFGQVSEFHAWNCSEWPTLTDGSACGTQAKYVAHSQKVTFGKIIKVPQQYVMLFSYGIVSALEMNKDTKSAWCLSLVPIEVWRRKRQNGGFDYKLSITVTNFDKHPTLKDKPEIPIKKFIGKTVEYNPYGN